MKAEHGEEILGRVVGVGLALRLTDLAPLFEHWRTRRVTARAEGATDTSLEDLALALVDSAERFAADCEAFIEVAEARAQQAGAPMVTERGPIPDDWAIR